MNVSFGTVSDNPEATYQALKMQYDSHKSNLCHLDNFTTQAQEVNNTCGFHDDVPFTNFRLCYYIKTVTEICHKWCELVIYNTAVLIHKKDTW